MQTRGVKVDAIDNDGQGRYEVVVITEYTVAQVTGIATDTTTTGSNAWATNTYYFGALGVANSKLVTSDTLAVGDYVTYVEYPNSRAAAQGAARSFGRIARTDAVGRRGWAAPGERARLRRVAGAQTFGQDEIQAEFQLLNGGKVLLMGAVVVVILKTVGRSDVVCGFEQNFHDA